MVESASSQAMVHETVVAAARRRGSVVAAVAGLLLVPYFWFFSTVVGWPGWDAPPPGAASGEFVDFYVSGAEQIPIVATVAIGSWVIWLILVVSVVRAACERLDLAAILAVTLAGASTAVYVAAEGVLAWPTVGLAASEIPANLDPGVAQAIVMSRDGLHAAASVLLGLSLIVVAWLLTRSDLWGHWLLAGAGFLAGVSASAAMIVGPAGIGPGGIMIWGILVAAVTLIGLRRQVRL